MIEATGLPGADRRRALQPMTDQTLRAAAEAEWHRRARQLQYANKARPRATIRIVPLDLPSARKPGDRRGQQIL